MLRTTLFFFILVGLNMSAIAQNDGLIKGFVTDPAENIKLGNSTIAILNSKDSTLIDFTRAATDGSFTIQNLKLDSLILMITYPGYADYVEHFRLDASQSTIDFANINLVLKAKLLEEVVIKGKAAAITINGDTTEYNAAAFVVQPNAKVEDLLKQFPGIQVDKDGKITAQGETVSKVLVDGEEFFGDDPTLVTKNLRADMVDKVQLYDKTSDQAAFTGIDDGIKTKTLNIKLKEDKKNGYFGKVEVGGTKDYNEQQGMLNIFSPKHKIAVYGTHSNTEKTGLSWSDSNRFNEGNRDGISYNGEGLPESYSAGAHYDTKWNKDKESININYKIGAINTKGFKNTLNQNNLPTGVLLNNSDETFSKDYFQQKLDATYRLKIDSTSDLKLYIDGLLRKNGNQNDIGGTTTSGSNALRNRSIRLWDDQTDRQNFSASAFWSKKMKKKGRTISLDLRTAANNSDNEGYLNSVNEFYNPQNSNIQDSVVNVDQLKMNYGEGFSFGSNATYTEPFLKGFSLILNYGIDADNSVSDRQSYNKGADGAFSDFDEAFSNKFELKQFSHRTGAIINYKKGETTVNFGSRISFVNFEQIDKYNNDYFSRDFINLNPQVYIRHSFSKQRSIRLDYNGSNRQPSVSEIQPVRTNNDPLNIRLGNPALKPSFSNRFSLSFNDYKVISGQSIYATGGYNFTSNDIVDSRSTDAVGVSRFQSVNLTSKSPSNYWAYFHYSKSVKALWNANIGMELNTNGNTYFSYINDQLNRTISNSISPMLTVSKWEQKKFELYFNFGPSYNRSESSLQPELNNNGWGWSGYGSIGLYLPGKIQISTSVNYTYQPKTVSFNQAFEQTILNARLEKKFSKNDNFTLALSGRDLLNQNTGFQRNAYGNTITETRFNTIRRYFMLSFSWDFNKMGGLNKSKAETE